MEALLANTYQPFLFVFWNLREFSVKPRNYPYSHVIYLAERETQVFTPYPADNRRLSFS